MKLFGQKKSNKFPLSFKTVLVVSFSKNPVAQVKHKNGSTT